MHATDRRPEPPALDRAALFFDLDGTLAPLARTPGAVRVPQAVKGELERARAGTGGAVAILSGRPIADIDGLLAPVRLAAAGQHGAEWRGPDGTVHRLAIDAARLDEMAAALQALAGLDPGLLLERKGMALAVHYRNAPGRAGQVLQAMQGLLRPDDDFALQPGKMVVEIKPRQASKGAALRRLMAEPAFAGRVPLFAGDDLTDEAGFEAVHALGGVSVKIGPGPTLARYRLASPQALARWLALAH